MQTWLSRREHGWLGAAAPGKIIPLAMVVGIMAIDPAYFGAWMRLASMALAISGLGVSWRRAVT